MCSHRLSAEPDNLPGQWSLDYYGGAEGGTRGRHRASEWPRRRLARHSGAGADELGRPDRGGSVAARLGILGTADGGMSQAPS